MNSTDRGSSNDAPTEDLATAISTLIDNAVASFETNPLASRQYLARASALLRARLPSPSGTTGRRGPRPKGGLAGWQMRRLLEYIETRLANRIQSGDLARRINLSVGQLFRAFRASTGVSPGDYVAARRVDLACTMMKTTALPLSDIAIACGLCDQSHLCRVFRRTLGTTPAVWRRENMGEPQSDALSVHPILLGPGRSLADVALACGFPSQSHFTRMFSAQVGRSPGSWRRGQS